MKKKQKTGEATVGAAPAAVETAPTPMLDVKALVNAHSAFFDKLVELIPAKFYLPPEEDVSGKPKPYFHGLSKAAKASLKRQTKQNLKLARRDRLDPEKISESSTLDLLKKSIESSEKPASDDEDGDTNLSKPINLEDQKSVTYEELREKLRRKIEMLRGNRGEGSRFDNRNRTNKRRGYENNEREKKRKRDGEESSGKEVNLGNSEGEEIIEYGKVRVGDEQVDGKMKKKRKMSKTKELERAKRLEEVKKENPKIAEREWWKTATNRAMGVKVHDDPKLLKEKLKKEKKRKEKHAEKWKDRVESQEKSQQERQQKRKENITGRINEKKTRKIAKREKKLMRPGFEGRKEGYITQE